MVQIISLGLFGLCALGQFAAAAPHEKRAFSTVTTTYTTTLTQTGVHNHRTHTTTEVVTATSRVKVSPTHTKKSKTTKTKTTKTSTSSPTVTSTTSTSTSTSATTTTSSTTTSASPTATAGTCAAIGSSGSYTDSDGTSYTVSCGTDYYGGDLSNTSADSFEDCFDLCDNASGCIAISWVGQGASHVGPGTCYLKSTLEAAVSNSNVDGAYVNN